MVIYTVYELTCEEGLKYFGKTKKTLNERYRQHKKSSLNNDKRRMCTSRELFKNNKIVKKQILGEFKSELAALLLERYYILTEKCVNIHIPLNEKTIITFRGKTHSFNPQNLKGGLKKRFKLNNQKEEKNKNKKRIKTKLN